MINFERVRRLPKRVRDDLKIVRLVKNWSDLLRAKRSGEPIKSIHLRNGVVLESPPEINLSFLFHEIWIDRIYTPRGYRVRENDIVIDIGANIGVFATFAATQAQGVHVYSFEPFPQNAEILRENIRRSNLSNVCVYKQAVAARPGMRTLQVADRWILHKLFASENSGGLEVDCTSLINILKETGYCNLLKLDCEGSEYEIFKSLEAQQFGLIKQIVCEFHNNEQGTGHELKALLEYHAFQVDYFIETDTTSGFLCATNLCFRKKWKT